MLEPAEQPLVPPGHLLQPLLRQGERPQHVQHVEGDLGVLDRAVNGPSRSCTVPVEGLY